MICNCTLAGTDACKNCSNAFYDNYDNKIQLEIIKEFDMIKIAEIKVSDERYIKQIAENLDNKGFEVAYDDEYPNYIYLMKRVETKQNTDLMLSVRTAAVVGV